MTPEQHQIVLDALKDSVDAVRNDYANAKELYGNYPARKHRLYAMLAELENHNAAIAIMEADGPEADFGTMALRQAAQAVVDRWDTPLWKDAPATAGYIAELRKRLGEA